MSRGYPGSIVGRNVNTNEANEWRKPAGQLLPCGGRAFCGLCQPSHRLSGFGGWLHHGMSRVFQAKPLHLFVERGAVDSQRFGRELTVPTVGLQDVFNDLPLGGL